MNQSEQAFAGIDETIGQVEKLYKTVTGTDAPQGEGAYAPIPAEKDPAQHVEEQLNRLLEVLGQVKGAPEDAPTWMPAMSVWENDAEIMLCMDLAGLKRDQVQVIVHGNAITVSGARLDPREGYRLQASERPLGPFRRTLMLPAGARGSEPSAQMRDGVLEITIPKPAGPATAPKPVPVH